MFINEVGDWLDDWSSNAIYYINKKKCHVTDLWPFIMYMLALLTKITSRTFDSLKPSSVKQ